MEAARKQAKKNFVLVHGSCHGAWCWYKLKPLLESSGHRVTALDLSASGINTKTLDQVHTFEQYSAPLMELMASIPEDDEKVILVGHSFGGLSLALAMDKYPEKISDAVFLTAYMPDTDHHPSYVVEQLVEKVAANSANIDRRSSSESAKDPLTSLLFVPELLSTHFYQNCSAEDRTLATMLMRPGSTFLEDLSTANRFSKEGYGKVKRVYIVCKDDKAITMDFQLWMIKNGGVNETKEIEGADHMAMLSKPQVLCQYLLEI